VPHAVLQTSRLTLLPITLSVVEAIMLGRREDAEALIGARLPVAWPNNALIERAFCASLDRIREDPDSRLWGDRVMITRASALPSESGTMSLDLEGPRVVGSVVFHGAPDHDGEVEVAYGVEEDSQLRGYATEAVRASVEWALCDPRVRVVRATTPPWHMASRRVLEKVGMRATGTREHELLGDLLEYERKADPRLRALPLQRA
jgi:[ribosomal protein S5]-alanine N-acetyltransferase